ncbi:MAG: hypothetical protein SOR65_08820 [Odoribacter sp.]|nr:hypothetical protein [Odoribacter sp.]
MGRTKYALTCIFKCIGSDLCAEVCNVIVRIRRPKAVRVAPNDVLQTSHRCLTPLLRFPVLPPKFLRSSSERIAGSNGEAMEELRKKVGGKWEIQIGGIGLNRWIFIFFNIIFSL